MSMNAAVSNYYKPKIAFVNKKYVKSVVISSNVEIAGPLTVAGSKCIFFARIGREHPKHLAITIVKNIVIETSMATCVLDAISMLPLTIIPTFNSNHTQKKFTKAKINPVINDTLNSFHKTFK